MGRHARQKSEIVRSDNQHGHAVEFECVPSTKKLREMYLIFDGGRIAYRGRPHTSEAGRWVSIVPGYTVLDEREWHRGLLRRQDCALRD
jgi:hypothetical protein